MVGKMIAEARLAKGWTQSDLAKKVGTSQQQIARYESESQDMKSSMLLKMSSALGVTVTYLLGMEKGSKVSSSSFSPVPLYGRVAAGVPIEMIKVEEMKEAPSRFSDDDPNAFFVRVIGNSMDMDIHSGELALISPKYNEPNGRDIFLVAVNGDDATIKRIELLDNGLRLCPNSTDPTFRPRLFDFGNSDTERVSIIGKVVWHCADF